MTNTTTAAPVSQDNNPVQVTLTYRDSLCIVARGILDLQYMSDSIRDGRNLLGSKESLWSTSNALKAEGWDPKKGSAFVRALLAMPEQTEAAEKKAQARRVDAVRKYFSRSCNFRAAVETMAMTSKVPVDLVLEGVDKVGDLCDTNGKIHPDAVWDADAQKVTRMASADPAQVSEEIRDEEEEGGTSDRDLANVDAFLEAASRLVASLEGGRVGSVTTLDNIAKISSRLALLAASETDRITEARADRVEELIEERKKAGSKKSSK